MIVQWIGKMLAALNSNTRPAHIAGALAFGFLLGITPASALNPLWWFLFIVTFFLKINIPIELAGIALFRLCSPLTAPLAEKLGTWLLTRPEWEGFFTSLKNTPFLTFTEFDYTGVTGALFLGLLLWLPLFGFSLLLVKLYRTYVREKLGPRVSSVLGKVPLFKKLAGAYSKARDLYNTLG